MRSRRSRAPILVPPFSKGGLGGISPKAAGAAKAAGTKATEPEPLRGNPPLIPPLLKGGKSGLLVLLVLLTSLGSPLAAQEPPGLEFDADGRLVLHSLPPVLGHDEVRPNLTKGLTTTFLLRVDPKGTRLRARPRPQGGARIEIRYELWDEVFHVATGTADGGLVRRTLDSFGELESWWQGLRLVVAGSVVSGSGTDPPRPREARVELDVVPFSQAEQRDTQRWFSESLDDAGSSGAEDIADSADKTSRTLDRTFHLLMATSIHRRALASYGWTVPIAAPSS